MNKIEENPTVGLITDSDAETESAPLSFAQRRLWFLDRMEPAGPLYHIPNLVHLRGRLDVAALRRALVLLVERHETLRLLYSAERGEPAQRLAPASGWAPCMVDLESVPESDREAELRRRVGEEIALPFDLGADFKLRATLYRLSPDRHVLLLLLHHIAADGWSMSVLYRELGACYRTLSNGGVPRLASFPIQYTDYAAWQRQCLDGARLRAMISYWTRQLAGAPPLLELPSDRPRPAIQSHRGALFTTRLRSGLAEAAAEAGRKQGATPFMVLLAAFKALVHLYTGATDIVIGTPVAGRDPAETEPLVGCFVNTVALRTRVEGDPTFAELVAAVRETALEAYDRQVVPFEKLVELLQPDRNLSYDPLCQVMFSLQNLPESPFDLPGLETRIEAVHTGTSKTDLSVWLRGGSSGTELNFEYSTDLFNESTISRMAGHYEVLLGAASANPGLRLSELPLLTAGERHRIVDEFNATEADYPRGFCIHQLIEAQARSTPAATALVFEDREWSYGKLGEEADRVAAALRRRGVGPDVPVCLCAPRGLGMMAGLLGILKAGGAYVPLDPSFPKERLSFMLDDAQPPVLLADRRVAGVLPESEVEVLWLDPEGLSAETEAASGAQPATVSLPGPEDIAYILYTSGSTGKPKGVMVTHRNVVNFFAGMDRVLGKEPGVWLALTSISFDISVLELFWTLARGYRVVLLAEQGLVSARKPEAAPSHRQRVHAPDFSLFYFACDDGEKAVDKYRLLRKGAQFADEHGFRAVWTPERHFHSFGGLYPNPSVTGAAIAAVTRRIGIRAGSVVLPLHNPLRVAEEWSVVDNLSQGRAGVSFASGWHDRDFTLAPDNFDRRKDLLRREIETVRSLWRGEAVSVAGPRGKSFEVRCYPRPVQAELPVWMTIASSVEGFRLAGELGINVLTHLIGQTVDELAGKIRVYRESRRARGFDAGLVTVALHSFLGSDAARIRAAVRGPLRRYCVESIDLLESMGRGRHAPAEAWSEGKREALVERAVDRFIASEGLFGSPKTCRETVERLVAAGADELACLIDFGMPEDQVLDGLVHLDRLREDYARPAANRSSGYTLAEQAERHGATHLQCTPSHARMLLHDPASRDALRPLRHLLVGGEALPADLADMLARTVSGTLHNMYGPTETTVWSTSAEVGTAASAGGVVPIGRPLANTRVHILDARLQPVPVGLAGELYIGGKGVARGYWRRKALTAQRFVSDPFEPGQTLYRTGDLGRYCEDGTIEFLGRIDQQVKVRGHRVEPGEIEVALAQLPSVRQSVVTLRTDNPDNPRLVAYLVCRSAAPSDSEIRTHLAATLPAHMIPDQFVALQALPLTPNGKVDRRALPEPVAGGPPDDSSGAYEPPASARERAIASIWQEVLSLESPGMDDNFFELGGHSLQVVQVQSRLRETLGAEVSVITLFQHPTIRTLAAHLATAAPADGAGRTQPAESSA